MITWKYIFVLSNGAIVVLAIAPATAPAIKPVQTLLLFEICNKKNSNDYQAQPDIYNRILYDFVAIHTSFAPLSFTDKFRGLFTFFSLILVVP